ncbi:MAG: reprolysin-like metallopeptidase [Saprospiraceae bacterium]
MKKKLLTIGLLFVALNHLLIAQNSSSVWTALDDKTIDVEKLRLPATEFDLYDLDVAALQTLLAEAKLKNDILNEEDLVEIKIPSGERSLQRFALYEAPVMEAPLQAKYPEIRTYTGRGIDNPRQIIKLDLGPAGFHAMIFSNEETVVIEPAYEDDLSTYMAFHKNDLPRDEAEAFSCGTTAINSSSFSNSASDGNDDTAFMSTGTELRTYRLALATTGEYSAFHGGTKPLVLAAMATVMNRVNGVYERDVTVTMIMIANTDTLIYFDGGTDPYTNNNGGAMLDQNNDNINAIIGSDNYDIGHVFSTGGGGIAGLGVVCGELKGWGVTGLNSPIDDVFSIDYVAHEMGHQFSGNHTFNACGGGLNQGPQPYEPGSAVTIMGYAGICGQTNIAENSIDQFHVASYDEIIQYSQEEEGNTCPEMTATNNTPPTVEAGEGGFFIPYQTPFELTGSATDEEGDSLTYCWEQYDLGSPTHPDDALGTAPLFRSWKPEDHPTRIFPRISDIVNNIQTTGELMAQFGREMNFRLIVRDNVPGGGGVDYDQLTFDVADNAGPFLVMAPNGGETWAVGSLQNIMWDVANTDLSPVNCSEVNIFLSEDGGFTYPHTVATNLPNTGSAVVQIPDVVGGQIRAKIKGADNVFFDISNENFTIIPAAGPDFVFLSNTNDQTICDTESVEFEVSIAAVDGYNDPVNLSASGAPAGFSLTFSDNDVVPPADVIITATADNTVVNGEYDIVISLSGTTGDQELPITIKVTDGAPAIATLSGPENGAVGVAANTTFTWEELPTASSYNIEVSLTADFSNIVYTGTNLIGNSFTPNSSLNKNTVYFWRVRGFEETCGEGSWSPLYSFQTELSACEEFIYGNVPLDIPNSSTISAELNVFSDITVADVNVTNLTGEHGRVGQLTLALSDPSGNSAVLFGGICGNDNDFDLKFDDDGLGTGIPCPPVDGMTYQAEEALSIFNGESAQGIWSLDITDAVNPTTGDLTGWSLEICGPEPSTEQPNLDLNGGEVLQGGTLNIVPLNITGDCSGSTDGLTYTITSLPMNGELFVDGTAAAIGTSFTQSDIDNGLLSYVNDGEDLDPDEFGFILSCDNGLYVGGLVMDIFVVLSIDTDDLDELSFVVAPNPALDYFEVRMNQAVGSDYNLNVTDMLGRVVYEQTLDANITRVSTSVLSAGVYSVQVIAGGNIIGEEKLVVVE